MKEEWPEGEHDAAPGAGNPRFVVAAVVCWLECCGVLDAFFATSSFA